MEQNKFDPLQFIGFLLISAILMFWFYDNQSNMIENQQQEPVESVLNETPETSSIINDSSYNTDTIDIEENFKDEIITLENDNILIELSTRGANLNKLLLKNFNNYNDEPLFLINDNNDEYKHDEAQLLINDNYKL